MRGLTRIAAAVTATAGLVVPGAAQAVDPPGTKPLYTGGVLRSDLRHLVADAVRRPREDQPPAHRRNRRVPAGVRPLGPYAVVANPDGSIVRADVASGRSATVKPAGTKVMAVDVWGGYVGWAEWRSGGGVDVAYRNLGSGAATVRRNGPVTEHVAVTGGHLVYGGEIYGRPHPLYEWRLGSTATATITSLAYDFAAHDETLAWTGEGRTSRIAPNSSYADPPKYLGNALGLSYFTPNGDGQNDRWTPEFPISKRLTSCAVTIRNAAGSVVRQLACPTVTGSARVSWDGRDGAGRLVPKARYTWTLTGSDSDGALRWWSGVTRPITGTVTVV